MFIITSDSLTVMRDGRPATLNRHETGEDTFVEACNAVSNGNLDFVNRLLDRGLQVNQYFEGEGVEVREGVLFYGDKQLDLYPAKKAVEFWKKGLPTGALVAFIKRLLNNPSFRAVQDLYSFLEHNKMPLTSDGCFLAYKKIRRHKNEAGEWENRDVYTGKIRNNVGDVIKMPRNQVDENPNQTCSRGLHVCGYDYLPMFGARNWDEVVVCKVDPANVVAIPVDYNNVKMRVCEYEVIEELKDYTEPGHLWSDVEVCVDYDLDDDDDPFEEDEDEDEYVESEDAYSTPPRSEAVLSVHTVPNQAPPTPPTQAEDDDASIGRCVTCTQPLDEDGDCENPRCPDSYCYRPYLQ